MWALGCDLWSSGCDLCSECVFLVTLWAWISSYWVILLYFVPKVLSLSSLLKYLYIYFYKIVMKIIVLKIKIIEQNTMNYFKNLVSKVTYVLTSEWSISLLARILSKFNLSWMVIMPWTMAWRHGCRNTQYSYWKRTVV